MFRPLATILITCAAVAGLAGCTQNLEYQLDQAHYWQRSDLNESRYLGRQQAQQYLNRDISQCVVDIRDLERMGNIRRAIPADTDEYGNWPDPHSPQGALAGWETPEREGYLRAEHYPYHDFETCMRYKGWERIEHVAPVRAYEARENYKSNLLATGHMPGQPAGR